MVKKKKLSLSNPLLEGMGVLSQKNKIYLYYRLSEDPKGEFHIATSEDGFSFVKQKEKCALSMGYTKIDISECSYFSFSEQHNFCNVTFTRKSKTKNILEMAYSSDLFSWEYEGVIGNFTKGGSVAQKYASNNQQAIFLAGKSLQIVCSKDRIRWQTIAKITMQKEPDRIEGVINTKDGLLLFYSIYEKKRNYVYCALFDRQNPARLLWEPQEPIWEQPKEWKTKAKSLGVVLISGKVIGYWQVENQGIFGYVYALHEFSDGHLSKDISLRLKRSPSNPIIKPHNHNNWENFNTFNPAAIFDNGRIHILYRAQGYDYVSAIGYANSIDGIHIDERLSKPIYNPSRSFDTPVAKDSDISYQYVSGGGYGGCEDPRITKIDDRFYLTYVAFDGYNPPRVALTSITASDFLSKRWLWEKPVLISPPGVVDKSAVIFPEKIHGKYVIMHRIYPNILIDFIDRLEFDGKTWLEGKYKISPRPGKWDSRKIGAGAPPIKTKYGWLLIYQSVGEQDSGRYKIGAMLLDLDDPTKVLYRSQSPILEPDASYENDGFKAGVVYPCGAIVKDGILYVYYGGADSYVCVATADLDEFLDELRFSKLTKLTKPTIKKILL